MNAPRGSAQGDAPDVGTGDLATLKHRALITLRCLQRLEALYLALRGSGLREALPQKGAIEVGDHLAELIEQMGRAEQELDWELTSEIVRLKDVLSECTARYARKKYGMTRGGFVRLPAALPNLPRKLRLSEITFIDETDYELRVSGNPVRSDGTTLSEQIDLLVGPDGIKVRVKDAARREQLRARFDR
jgi:hypothetical protein